MTFRDRKGVEQGEVGRNAPCPCGSGKKRKKCHPVEASPSGTVVVHEKAKHAVQTDYEYRGDDPDDYYDEDEEGLANVSERDRRGDDVTEPRTPGKLENGYDYSVVLKSGVKLRLRDPADLAALHERVSAARAAGEAGIVEFAGASDSWEDRAGRRVIEPLDGRGIVSASEIASISLVGDVAGEPLDEAVEAARAFFEIQLAGLHRAAPQGPGPDEDEDDGEPVDEGEVQRVTRIDPAAAARAAQAARRPE